MFRRIQHKGKQGFFRGLTVVVILSFLLSSFMLPTRAQARGLNLPVPGNMLKISTAFSPSLIKGIKIDPHNPLLFEFLIAPGQIPLNKKQKTEEYQKLIKYFLASLTTPEKDMWVNLSPYEHNRVISPNFGSTEMGRDMLAQDYLLKQLSASLVYPEDDLGKKFWNKVYERVRMEQGTAEIPVNTLNKVWIIPQSATVFEKGNVAIVTESRLKVMMEADYMAMSKHNGTVGAPLAGAQTIREIILPEIEREINEGKNFAQLRQMYNSMILASWFKQRLKKHLLSKMYVNKDKNKGVELQDPKENEQIFERYVQAYKKGVYNYIKEEADPQSGEMIPRKYFSGGFSNQAMTVVLKTTSDVHAITVSNVATGSNGVEPLDNAWVQFDVAGEEGEAVVETEKVIPLTALEQAILSLLESQQKLKDFEKQKIDAGTRYKNLKNGFKTDNVKAELSVIDKLMPKVEENIKAAQAAVEKAKHNVNVTESLVNFKLSKPLPRIIKSFNKILAASVASPVFLDPHYWGNLKVLDRDSIITAIDNNGLYSVKNLEYLTLPEGGTVPQSALGDLYFGFLEPFVNPVVAKFKENPTDVNEEDIEGALNAIQQTHIPNVTVSQNLRERVRGESIQGKKQMHYATVVTAFVINHASAPNKLITSSGRKVTNIYLPRDMGLGYTIEMILRSLMGIESEPNIYYVSRDSMGLNAYNIVGNIISAAKSTIDQDKTPMTKEERRRRFIKDIGNRILAYKAKDKGFSKIIEQIEEEIEERGFHKLEAVRFVDTGFRTFPLMLEGIMAAKYGDIETDGLVMSSSIPDMLPQQDVSKWDEKYREMATSGEYAKYTNPNIDLENTNNFPHPIVYSASQGGLVMTSSQHQMEAYGTQLVFLQGALNLQRILQGIVALLPAETPATEKQAIAQEAVNKILGLDVPAYSKDFFINEVSFKSKDLPVDIEKRFEANMGKAEDFFKGKGIQFKQYDLLKTLLLPVYEGYKILDPKELYKIYFLSPKNEDKDHEPKRVLGARWGFWLALIGVIALAVATNQTGDSERQQKEQPTSPIQKKPSDYRPAQPPKDDQGAARAKAAVIARYTAAGAEIAQDQADARDAQARAQEAAAKEAEARKKADAQKKSNADKKAARDAQTKEANAEVARVVKGLQKKIGALDLSASKVNFVAAVRDIKTDAQHLKSLTPGRYVGLLENINRLAGYADQVEERMKKGRGLRGVIEAIKRGLSEKHDEREGVEKIIKSQPDQAQSANPDQVQAQLLPFDALSAQVRKRSLHYAEALASAYMSQAASLEENIHAMDVQGRIVADLLRELRTEIQKMTSSDVRLFVRELKGLSGAKGSVKDEIFNVMAQQIEENLLKDFERNTQAWIERGLEDLIQRNSATNPGFINDVTTALGDAESRSGVITQLILDLKERNNMSLQAAERWADETVVKMQQLIEIINILKQELQGKEADPDVLKRVYKIALKVILDRNIHNEGQYLVDLLAGVPGMDLGHVRSIMDVLLAARGVYDAQVKKGQILEDKIKVYEAAERRLRSVASWNQAPAAQPMPLPAFLQPAPVKAEMQALPIVPAKVSALVQDASVPPVLASEPITASSGKVILERILKNRPKPLSIADPQVTERFIKRQRERLAEIEDVFRQLNDFERSNEDDQILLQLNEERTRLQKEINDYLRDIKTIAAANAQSQEQPKIVPFHSPTPSTRRFVKAAAAVLMVGLGLPNTLKNDDTSVIVPVVAFVTPVPEDQGFQEDPTLASFLDSESLLDILTQENERLMQWQIAMGGESPFVGPLQEELPLGPQGELFGLSPELVQEGISKYNPAEPPEDAFKIVPGPSGPPAVLEGIDQPEPEGEVAEWKSIPRRDIYKPDLPTRSDEPGVTNTLVPSPGPLLAEVGKKFKTPTFDELKRGGISDKEIEAMYEVKSSRGRRGKMIKTLVLKPQPIEEKLVPIPLDGRPSGNKEDLLPLPDQAQSSRLEKGGIDFDPQYLELNLQGQAMDLPVPAEFQWLLNTPIQGFIPKILDIRSGMGFELSFFKGLLTPEQKRQAKIPTRRDAIYGVLTRHQMVSDAINGVSTVG